MTHRVFAVGDVVALRADRSRTGIVMQWLPPEGNLPSRYRVFHSSAEQYTYDHDQLVSKDEQPQQPCLLPVREFRARLTAARLAHPQVDTIYALRAARIKFIPYQMKPLMRILAAEKPRLLIADEVGVGKTIEAGLILKELETRQTVERVLIVCPKALTTKWKAEMHRFDEDFYILGADTLRHCIDETHRDGEWPNRYPRCIVPLELIRSAGYLDGTRDRIPKPGLRDLDPPVSFDMVIVDEAHHVRNQGTKGWEVVNLLCESSQAAVFLSATPVQLGSPNLFTLLNLLRPDYFQDPSVFEIIIEPNRYLTEAMSYVRTRAPAGAWQQQAYAALKAARKTQWGQQSLGGDPRFQQWYGALECEAVLNDMDRIRCLSDLQELHTLSSVMNRTRRRDIGKFTVREPHTISVPFTSEQEAFYQELVDLRREILLQVHDRTVAGLITDTLERQAASCLPAMLPALDRLLATGSLNLGEMSDDPLVDEEEFSLSGSNLLGRVTALQGIAEVLPMEDPKIEKLITIIDSAMVPSAPGKVLVFSFFLNTLDYLLENLRREGYRVGVITGKTPDELREELRTRFRLDRSDHDAIDVLLSSEVGCEGLDYEFCDRMVNYDIPWNPMRVEQRIGRIDRYGQRAEKVFIYNFVTPGTIEERIFYRCFERLGIFRDTVGDLEEVMGDMVEELSRAVMDPRLSPEQAENMAQQLADNALRDIEARQRLEQESSGVLGLDQALMDELDEAQRRRKFVSADDLRLMIEEYIAQPSLSARLTPDNSIPGTYRLTLRKEARGELYGSVNRARPSSQTREFLEFLASNQPYLLLTFEQETALDHRNLTFITPVHPLAKLAREHWQAREQNLATNLMVTDSSVPEGRYLFTCELWESVCMNPELRMFSLALDLESDEVSEEVSHDLLRLFESALDGENEVPDNTLDVATGLLEGEMYEWRQRETATLREQNRVLLDRRVASIKTYYTDRIQRAQEALAAATDERIRRMRQSQAKRTGSEFLAKMQELEARREADIVPHKLAFGVIQVHHGE